MKLVIRCTECAVKSEEGDIVHLVVQLQNDNVYKTVCPRGHDVVHAVVNERFELLFESGALALLDGYAREAVSSFAAAMERYHEYCIEIMTTSNEDVSIDSYRAVWKTVVKQSERQLGAFFFLYLNAFGEQAPWRQIENRISFRNNVIHQGYIPTIDEARSFGEAVFTYIHDVHKKIDEKFSEPIASYALQRQEALRETMGGGSVTWNFIQTMINFSFPFIAPPEESPDFNARIEALKRKYHDGWIYAK